MGMSCNIQAHSRSGILWIPECHFQGGPEEIVDRKITASWQPGGGKPSCCRHQKYRRWVNIHIKLCSYMAAIQVGWSLREALHNRCVVCVVCVCVGGGGGGQQSRGPCHFNTFNSLASGRYPKIPRNFFSAIHICYCIWWFSDETDLGWKLGFSSQHWLRLWAVAWCH